MGNGPCAPVQSHGLAGSNDNLLVSWSSTFVAGDVGGCVGIGRHEPIVKVVCKPAWGSWLWVLVQPVLLC